MTGNTESTLKNVLEAEAGMLDVTDDPWSGFERRERNHKRRRRAVAAGVVVALAAAGGVQAGLVPLPGWAPGIQVAGFNAALAEGPVRGSLAGDKALLEGVRQEIKDVEDPDETWRVADREAIKFVYAADVGNERLVLALVPLRFGFLEDNSLIWYTGEAGAPASKLTESGRTDGGDSVVTYGGTTADRPGTLVVVGPRGSTVSVSQGFRYTPEGTVEHGPAQVQPAGTGLAELTVPPSPTPVEMKVTVTSGPDTIYDGNANLGWAGNSPTGLPELSDATLAAALGDRDLDRAILRSWVNHALSDARLGPDGTAVTVRWTGTVNGQPAALFTIQPRGGGVLAYAIHGVETSYRQDLRLLLPVPGVAERPIAWRMRAEGKDDRTDRVIVTAPVGAERVELQIGGAAPVAVALDGTGAGTAAVPGSAEARVTAYGKNGSIMGSTPVPPFETDSGGLPGDTEKTRVVG
ncbi:hypothetical protein M1L60_39075 [Actinoplanes sp. TRM 88003]|uniref:DUF4179 domain-containing protein n=1 Tax=Paractinoplanes aksuensis TaxID=2939490 RepID=A0ABT1E0E3_9ACTN|nr:hypothetical protein [Actinoplanes aksuensis]MCO8276599.1 hypothetical protein [Actinoplanes aksuensis]